MNSMKKIVSSFMMDVGNYLSFIADYGKPNHKYFNFILNRMGLLYLFISKHEIFRSNSVVWQFVEVSLVALKKRFLTENSTLKRGAIIFLISKIFFTDDIGNLLRLRITRDEWKIVEKYLQEIKSKPEFLETTIMIYQLFTENFFKFTVRNKSIALDYGLIHNDIDEWSFYNRDAIFWNEIDQKMKDLEDSGVILSKLNSIREGAIKPFDLILPEKSGLKETLHEFEALKKIIKAPGEAAATSSKASKREIFHACREFLKSSSGANAHHVVELEVVEWNSDTETNQASNVSKTTLTAKSKLKKRSKPTDDDSSSTESEKDFRRMIRTLGYTSQNVMKGIGADKNMSEKLKQCYEK